MPERGVLVGFCRWLRRAGSVIAPRAWRAEGLAEWEAESWFQELRAKIGR